MIDFSPFFCGEPFRGFIIQEAISESNSRKKEKKEKTGKKNENLEDVGSNGKNFHSSGQAVENIFRVCYNVANKNHTRQIKQTQSSQLDEKEVKNMKWITDVHTHSDFSHDAHEPLSKILEAAYKKGVAFYGVSEHFNGEIYFIAGEKEEKHLPGERYFHTARHLQEEYEGAMNVLVGAEFGYDESEEVCSAYLEICQKYKPDFVVNSVHCLNGEDFYYGKAYRKEKRETYLKYLQAIRKSLDAPYPYDIVGHIGYVTRYAPYEDNAMTLEEYKKELDDIFLTIIKKDKILEVNSSNKETLCLPTEEMIKRYYELGGRKISFASDTHDCKRIADKREEVVAMLKKIGFTHITVPFKGEHIQVEI